MSATHKHKCDTCGHIWEHGNECRGIESAHRCAQCGNLQYYRYFGEPPLSAINILAKILTASVSRETETTP